MNSIVIFDTSVFVDYLRTGRGQDLLASVSGLIRTSAVVLSELWRGATKAAEHRFLRTLEKNHPILTPPQDHWRESGEILARLHAGKGLTPNKLRDLHFDVLIALTARSVGARVITSNRNDFEMIRTVKDFKLEIW